MEEDQEERARRSRQDFLQRLLGVLQNITLVSILAVSSLVAMGAVVGREPYLITIVAIGAVWTFLCLWTFLRWWGRACLPMAETASPKPPADRWWLWALLAAVIACGETALVLFKPIWPWTWIISIGVVVFAVVMWFYPPGWYRRMASGCLALAAASAAVPSLLVEFKAGSAWIKILLENVAPGLLIAFIVGSIAFAYMDFKARYRRTVGQ
jgi:hypothetical protein